MDIPRLPIGSTTEMIFLFMKRGAASVAAARIRRRFVSERFRSFSMYARSDACVSVEPAEESVIIVTSMR